MVESRRNREELVNQDPDRRDDGDRQVPQDVPAEALVDEYPLVPPRSRGPWKLVGCGVAAIALAAVLGIVAVLVAPELTRLSRGGQRAHCENNLRQIGLACHMYADDYDEKFPPDFKSLVPDYVESPEIFSCPSGPSSWQDFADGTATAESSSYEYLKGRDPLMPADFVLAYDRNLDHHKEGFNVLFCDAHVEWWHQSRLKEFNELIKAQEAAAEKIGKDPKKRARIVAEYYKALSRSRRR
jgi:prepilin-type processing-associated H-X9-DG protein